jgi:L-ascorbate metabolism protein UlaG (beta-lactamase superfamily)
MSDPSIEVEWLLQAGFRFRTPAVTVVVDAYLSDRCAEVYGLQRRADPPVAATELAADVVLVSHWHEDHLDLPTVLTALAAGAVVVAPPSCIDRISGAGGSADQLRPITAGHAEHFGEVTVTAVPARHAVPGYLTEDAVGYVIEAGGVRIYHSGDTDYDRSLLAAGVGTLDLALVCVNGTGGNMNPAEAAALVHQLAPRTAMPMHIGLWTDAGYGPEALTAVDDFAELCGRLAPDTSVIRPEVGVRVRLTRGT